MKKILLGLLLCLALSGCGNSVDKNGNSSVKDADVTYSQQDFCLYGEPDEAGNSNIIAWIGMTSDKVNPSDSDFRPYYYGFDNGNGIGYEIGNDISGNEKDVVNYLNYTGAGKAVYTSKGIVTYGFEFREGDYVSNVDDVINNYQLDVNNESIYSSYTDDNNCVISLYFNIDSDKNVTRIVSPLNTDISDIKNVNADYSIRFIIIDGKVCGIQLYRDHTKLLNN